MKTVADAANRPTRSKRLLVVAGTVLVAALLGTLAFIRFGAVLGGPLESPGMAETGLPPDIGVASVGIFFPRLDSPIEIISVEPVNPTGVNILGFGLLDNPKTGVGVVAGWPPPIDEALTPIEGAIVSFDHLDTLPLIVMGVEKLDPDQAEPGRIDGFRIRYKYQGTTYETVLNQSFLIP